MGLRGNASWKDARSKVSLCPGSILAKFLWTFQALKTKQAIFAKN